MAIKRAYANFLLCAEQSDTLIDHLELDQPILVRIAYDAERIAAFFYRSRSARAGVLEAKSLLVTDAEMLWCGPLVRLGFPMLSRLVPYMLETILAFFISNGKIFP